MPSGNKNNDFEARLYRAKRNRACDSCRRRKARCDGYEMLDNLCTTCVTYGVECTYFESSKKPTAQSYVRELENRLAQVERLVRELSNPNSQTSRSLSAKGSPLTNLTAGQGLPSSPFARVPQVDSLGSLPEVDEQENDDFTALYDSSKGFVDSYKEGGTPKFFGESSAFTFTQALGKDALPNRIPSGRRQEFWTAPKWLPPLLRGPRMTLVFPEPSLTRHLLDIYFDIHNIVLPILHRPTFERLFARKLHERDESFGSVVILMCAIACRYSDDPRVKHPIVTSTSNTGWNMFNQVDRLRRIRLIGHQLYDAQIYALAACFLDGFSPPQGPWTMVGIGLRVMQDVGVHRRKFTLKKSVENELWKRCFWVLVIMDRTFSNLLGRSCAIQDEDFDVDLPLNCDDEYLEHPDPERAFKQPEGVPSQMDYFISMIRLNQILGFSQRTLYSTRKSRAILGYVGNRWESHILSSLESSLKKWADSIPPHLRWDAQKDQTNMTWLRQALSLIAGYYELQIIIHRPFIMRPDPALSGPALTRCREAARGCVTVFGSVKDKVNGKIRCHPYVKPMMLAALLLLRFCPNWSVDKDSEVYSSIMTIRDMIWEVGLVWTTGKRLIGVMNAAMILSDCEYEGWQPGKEDLREMQANWLCFIDKCGRLSSKEAQWLEEHEDYGTDSCGSASAENTPSPQSVPSVERSVSGSSFNEHSARSPGSIEEASPKRTLPGTFVASEVALTNPEPVPRPVERMKPPGVPVPSTVQAGFVPGISGVPGGPPSQGGKFFHNPENIRTLMTGSGDGYRSPEPPSRLDTLSPLHHVYREHPRQHGGPSNSGIHLGEVHTEWLGRSSSAQPPVATQPPSEPSFSMEHGFGRQPPSLNSSVLPAELMVYNDLMMDIGTAQYLGAGMRSSDSLSSGYPPVSMSCVGGVDAFGLSVSGHQWQGASQPGMQALPQTAPLFGYPQSGQLQRGEDWASTRQTDASFGWQSPTGGIADYDAWERALYENFMKGLQANQVM